MQGVKKTEFLYIFACIFYVFLAFLSVFRYIFVALSFWRGHFFFHADRRMHFPAFHRTDQIQNCQDSRISCKNSSPATEPSAASLTSTRISARKTALDSTAPATKLRSRRRNDCSYSERRRWLHAPSESVPARRPKPPDLHGRFPDVFQFHTVLHFPSIRIITEETALQTATESRVSGSLHY